MKNQVHRTVQFGEVVVAAFDQAKRYTTNPREVSHLATQAVAHMWRHMHRPPIAESSIQTKANP